MATTPPVLLLEFNELSPRLMDQFVAAGQLPNFKILHDESEIYVTGAVEKYPYLEPWIQWITVHCGAGYSLPDRWTSNVRRSRSSRARKSRASLPTPSSSVTRR